MAVYKDIDVSFRRNPATGDVDVVYDHNAVKQSLEMLILTALGERLFHPEIGTSVQSILFEQANPATKITLERSIRQTVRRFEPRVTLTSALATFDSNLVTIDIQYVINNIPTSTQSVRITLERER